jgi:C4-dicarboxylate-specific signal transduction histidine kinase
LDKKQQKFCVNECIDEVLQLLKDNVKHNGIDIKVLASNQYYINSLRGEFVQVMFNLLNNAKHALLKNNIENPHIVIEIFTESEHIIVRIKDNALGIKPEIMEKVFEPYFTTKEDGLGLGLYMSKMIVEKNMKGHLSVHNTQDGACFSIKLKAI